MKRKPSMPPQATPPILVSQTEQVCTITLNRPEALNSLNVAAHEALLAALNEAAQNASVRAVVLAAQGRAFCVGQIGRAHV